MTSLTNRIAAVQACLNGSRSPAEHAAVPVTAAELAAAAASAVATGAGSLHCIRGSRTAASRCVLRKSARR